MKKPPFVLLTLLPGLSLYAQHLPPPDGLLCDLLREPAAAVITDATPEFGWVFPQSGIDQAGYRILVASSPHLLSEGKADCWDSGKVTGPQSLNVAYAGKPLKDHGTYWWQVKVWSGGGLTSAYSVAQPFHTGRFDRSHVEYPGQSAWVELGSGQWVSEDKQCATIHRADPVARCRPAPGALFVEFDKSAIGILEFTATARQETPITMHLGERAHKNHTVHKDPGRSNIGYNKVEMVLKEGTHRYVAKIPERKIHGYLHSQKLAPHYPEVMPFRYVEILGDFKMFAIDRIQQGGLFYYFDENASAFTCSNENLNKVWDLCKYTQKATPFLGVYADGNRERMPYEADAYIQQLSHFAVDREYSISKYTINFLFDHASWPTEWQMHTVLMAWAYYMHTGDDTLLRDRYDDLRHKTLVALTDDTGLISTRTGKKTQAFLDSMHFPGKASKFRDIVDWPQGKPRDAKQRSNQSPLEGGETDGFVFTDYNAVVNAFHYRCLVLMSRIAGIVGNTDDEFYFTGRAVEHKEIFTKTFFDLERGIYKDGESTDHASLHANMFPMAFGLVDESHRASVATFIKSRGMACSVYGSQYLLEALYEAGEPDHALGLMTSDSKRSWLNMLRVGSSMTTEAWDEYYKPNLTWNHAWGSAPANIIARKLMGIEPMEPSFRTFRICPQPGKLTKASIRVPTLRGSIESTLVNKDKSWNLEVSVPGNAKAELWLPDRFSTVTINGRKEVSVGAAQHAGTARNRFLLRSGHHLVTAEQVP